MAPEGFLVPFNPPPHTHPKTYWTSPTDENASKLASHSDMKNSFSEASLPQRGLTLEKGWNEIRKSGPTPQINMQIFLLIRIKRAGNISYYNCLENSGPGSVGGRAVGRRAHDPCTPISPRRPALQLTVLLACGCYWHPPSLCFLYSSTSIPGLLVKSNQVKASTIRNL